MLQKLIVGWDFLEGVLGLLAMFFLALAPATVAVLVVVFAALLGEWKPLLIGLAVAAPTCPMAWLLIRTANTALDEFVRHLHQPNERRLAFAIHLVAHLPQLSRLLSSVVGLWWGTHFLACTLIVDFALSRVGGLGGLGWSLVIALGIAYLIHFAGNVFLALSVSSLSNSPKITSIVWRWRFLLDAVLVGVALIV
jgi:hypothetical protein